MSDKSTKWLFGCGIGCGAVFLIVVAIFVSVYYMVKDTVEEVKMVSETTELLESRFGGVYSYIPASDGTIDPERIKKFIAIRDSLLLISDDFKIELNSMTGKISELEDKKEETSFWDAFDVIKGGLGVIPEIIKYYSTRNMILFEEGMGLGEYNYLYAISYYSYLGKYPGDGPDLELMEGGTNIKIRDGVIKTDTSVVNEIPANDDEVRIQRNDKLRRLVNRMTRKMYSNTLKNNTIDEFWKKAFSSEIDELSNNLVRLPWENGLPTEMERSLSLYKEDLLRTYDEMLNSIELLEINEFVDQE